jgi:hypothetical protein
LETPPFGPLSDRTVDALLSLYRNRFGQQIEPEAILACWD